MFPSEIAIFEQRQDIVIYTFSIKYVLKTTFPKLVSGKHVAFLTLYLTVLLMDGESHCILLKVEVEDTPLHLL